MGSAIPSLPATRSCSRRKLASAPAVPNGRLWCWSVGYQLHNSRGGSSMGVQTDVVIADQSEAQDIANSDAPASTWDGFTFNGFHNVQLCTLLSLLKAGSPSAE